MMNRSFSEKLVEAWKLLSDDEVVEKEEVKGFREFKLNEVLVVDDGDVVNDWIEERN